MSEQMRAEFEVWFDKEKRPKIINESMLTVIRECMFEGWQASRQALVVDLPEGLAIEGTVSKHEEGFVDGYNDALKDARVSLDKAGVPYNV